MGVSSGFSMLTATYVKKLHIEQFYFIFLFKSERGKRINPNLSHNLSYVMLGCSISGSIFKFGSFTVVK